MDSAQTEVPLLPQPAYELGQICQVSFFLNCFTKNSYCCSSQNADITNTYIEWVTYACIV